MMGKFAHNFPVIRYVRVMTLAEGSSVACFLFFLILTSTGHLAFPPTKPHQSLFLMGHKRNFKPDGSLASSSSAGASCLKIGLVCTL